MLGGLDLVSFVTGAAAVAAVATLFEDGRSRRWLALGVALTSAAVAVAAQSTVGAVAALLALVGSALSMAAWLRDRQPVRLDVDEQRLRQLAFRDLTPRQLKSLLAASSSGAVAAGEPLLLADQPPDRVRLIVQGEASIVVAGEPRAELAAGRFVGEVGFVTGQPTEASVVAIVPVRYVEWTRDDLEVLFGRRPELRIRFDVAVARNLADKLRMMS